MSTIDRAASPAALPGSPAGFEALLTTLSSRFINLAPGAIDQEVEDGLGRVCEFFAIDLAVLWQWSAVRPDVVAPTHSYNGMTGERLHAPMSQEQYPWSRQQMLAGRVIAVSSLEDLNAEAAVDRETCRSFGIRSVVCLPLTLGGQAPVGALGFNVLRAERIWTDALVTRLQLVAQIFTNALARGRQELRLRESEETLRQATDSAEMGLWTLDCSTGAAWVTERTRALFGLAPDEVVDRARLEARIHPDDRGRVREAIERASRTGEPLDEEYRVVVPGENGERWIATRGRRRSSAASESERLMGVHVDISEHKRAEIALQGSAARLASGAELAGLAFYEVDFQAGVAHVDGRLRDTCGVPPDRETGLEVLEFWKENLHPEDRSSVLDLRQQLHDGRLEQVTAEYRFLHPARGQVWIRHVDCAVARDAAGNALATFGVLRDVTEPRQLDEDLRDLSRRLIGAHEEERALLARELHDDVTQRLAVLAIDIGNAETAMPAGAQREALRRARERLVSLSEDIHSLAYQLHPSVLTELGLAEALRAEGEHRTRQGRLDVSIDVSPLPAVIGKDAALCLFRVAQEALNNVTRHAGGRAASVTLRQHAGEVVLAVHDDGVGFDPEHPARRKGLGLASMRERVRLVRGTLDVESTPGRGTTIVARIPIEVLSP